MGVRSMIYDVTGRVRVISLMALVSLAIFCSSFISSVYAQTPEQQADLAVTAVTLHPGSAWINRTGTVNFPAGRSILIVEGLPISADLSQFEFIAADSSVEMLGLQMLPRSTTTPREDELIAESQQIQYRISTLNDEIETAESELDLLNSLSSSQSGLSPAVDGETLGNLVEVMSTRSNEARRLIRDSEIELQDLRRQQNDINRELSSPLHRGVTYADLRIELMSAMQTSSAVTLGYHNENAFWRWMYDARLDSSAKQLEFTRKAEVSQSTGEDWNDVALTLSTARFSYRSEAPELTPRFVNLGQARRVSPEIEEVVVTGSFVQSASGRRLESPPSVEVRDINYHLQYQLPSQQSIPSTSGEPFTVIPIDSRELAVELVTRSVPTHDLNAYLEARFEFNSEEPLFNGVLDTYRDGAFVGKGNFAETLPGETASIAFGRDQRIQVRRFDEQQNSRDTGIFTRSNLQEERIRYEITNRHSDAITFELLDQVPVARHADINVSIPRGATSATEENADGLAGVLLWRMELDPQETNTVRHYYDLSHPEGEAIHFSR